MISENTLKLRLPKHIHVMVMEDLDRSHAYAFERVGFIFCKHLVVEGCTIVTYFDYHPVADEDYIDNPRVGATINSDAIRKAMQFAYDNNCGCFHIHLHSHKGVPRPSGTDRKSLPHVVASMFNVAPTQVHGYMILSEDSISAYVGLSPAAELQLPDCISIVGYPMKFFFPKTYDSKETPKREETSIDDRQSFLGPHMRKLFDNVTVSVVGYGGGGSHIGQQLAHLGVKNVVVYDPDIIELSNLNRLVGASDKDVRDKTPKSVIAERAIKKILPSAQVRCINDHWQNQPEYLQQSDIVIGCIDTYSGREALEAEGRRYLIPLIDIGMDIYQSEQEKNNHYMSGQVILSMPGECCMKCLGFLTDEKLSKEAAKYGKVGGRPQVVWPNGVLASSAIGILVDLITGWTQTENRKVYLAYDGNRGTIQDHVRLQYATMECDHYRLKDSGTPRFVAL